MILCVFFCALCGLCEKPDLEGFVSRSFASLSRERRGRGENFTRLSLTFSRAVFMF
jgi:hypothetical protein